MCSYLDLKHIKKIKNIPKIQKQLKIQQKIVLSLHKALVTCKQKGNINK